MKRSALKRSGRLSAQSKRRREESKLRRELVAEYLAAHPWCERCARARSVEVHEKQKRSRNPKAWLSPELFAALCRSCHRFTEDEPLLATQEGWLIPSWIR